MPLIVPEGAISGRRQQGHTLVVPVLQASPFGASAMV
jgi:hypothetical protein